MSTSLRSFFLRRRSERARVAREVAEELSAHIELRAREYERAGMESGEALRQARRRFGSFRRVSRQSRRQRLAPSGGPRRPLRALARLVQDLRQDVAFALRSFARRPAFLVTSVVTLALGLGATTSIFSLANWLLFRPVPGVADPEDLSIVWLGQPLPEGGYRPSMLSYPNYEDVASGLTSLSGFAAFQNSTVSVTAAGSVPRRLGVHLVTETYFSVLGVEMAHGRYFTAADDDPALGSDAVVISHRLWATLFERDPHVLGKELIVNNNPFTIVGVAGEGFHGTERLGDIDLWVTGAAYARVKHFSDPATFSSRDRGPFYRFVARLADGATWPQVEAELAGKAEWLREAHPESNAKFDTVGFTVFRIFGNEPLGVAPARDTLTLLVLVSGLVLMIACANVANLLLIKGLGRRTEVAVRKALGAGRRRLLRQHLVEGVLLWLLGGAAGVGFAAVLTRLFQGSQLAFVAVEDVPTDFRVFGFAGTVALLVGIAFALVPALPTLRPDSASTLRSSTSGATRSGTGTRYVLTVVQLAASLMLLVGALLLVNTVQRLGDVDVGFETAGIYSVDLSPADMGYSQPEVAGYYSELVSRLRTSPSVSAAAVAYRAPLRCCGMMSRMRPAGAADEELTLTPSVNAVYSTQYFELLGIPVLRGRIFDEEDINLDAMEPRRVVVLSESLARDLFGDQDPVGRLVEYPVRNREDQAYTVIGVVGDAYYGRLTDGPDAMVYEPGGLDGFLMPGAMLLLRAGRPFDAGEAVRRIAVDLDASLPVGAVVPLRETIRESQAEWRMMAKLFSVLAGLAAALSAVGVYGVVSFAVSARAYELGVRLALGAAPREVAALVMRSTGRLTIAGVLLGLLGAAALARYLESRLFGVSPFDPAIWTLAATALATIALAAALVPSRRATRIDPVRALRAL